MTSIPNSVAEAAGDAAGASAVADVRGAGTSEAPARPYPKIELHVHLEGTLRAETLLEVARANGVRLPVDDVEPLDRRPAGVREEQPGQDPQRRRLAGAVRSDQPEDLPRRHPQVEPVERLRLAVGLAQPFGQDAARCVRRWSDAFGSHACRPIEGVRRGLVE